MPYSTSIMASIHSKEAAIQACRAEIARLEGLADRQQSSSRGFDGKAEEFEYAIGRKRRKAERVADHAPESTLAGKFALQMDMAFSASSWNQQKGALMDISANMRRELAATRAALDGERARLACLQGELAALNAQYGSALRREAQEAAAASAGQ